MALQSPIQRPWNDVGKVLSLWKELTVCEGRYRVWVGEIQLKIHTVCSEECFFHVLSNKLPDFGVRDVNCSEEVGWREWVPTQGPQEGVESVLLQDTENEHNNVNDQCSGDLHAQKNATFVESSLPSKTALVYHNYHFLSQNGQDFSGIAW